MGLALRWLVVLALASAPASASVRSEVVALVLGPCVPITCMAQGANCGLVGDGCGGVLNCGSCTPPQRCGGGVPAVCAGAAVDAGSVGPDGGAGDAGVTDGMLDSGASGDSASDGGDPGMTVPGCTCSGANAAALLVLGAWFFRRRPKFCS